MLPLAAGTTIEAIGFLTRGGRKETPMRKQTHSSVLAAALFGAAAFLPLPALAIDDDVDVDAGADVEVDRDRPGLLPGEPLEGPDADVYVETPDADADAEAHLDADDDDADVEIEADKD
jgi:hypothetical protein